MFEGRSLRRLFRRVARLALSAVLVLGAALGSLWLEHRTDVTLPSPTGGFAVGRALYDWVDDETVDRLAPVPGTKRELLVWIWYPAAASETASVADYLPTPFRAAIERETGVLLGKFLTRDLSKVHPHSLRDAGMSRRESSYPVVILRAGASAAVAYYSTLAEDLASHGYVVVGFDVPYRTYLVGFPDGRVMRRTPSNNPEGCLEREGQERERCANRLLTAWTSDMAFVLDRLERVNASDASGRFTGRLDLTRVGVLGHSFGGAAAAAFCHEDGRCKAGIDVDGAPHGRVIEEGIDRPFLFLLSDHSDESDPENRRVEASIQSIYDRLPADGRRRIVIRGANHFLFSDDGALLKSHMVLGTLRMLGILGLDGRRQLAVTAYCLRSFFDVTLKGVGSLEISSPLYPEIQVVDDESEKTSR